MTQLVPDQLPGQAESTIAGIAASIRPMPARQPLVELALQLASQ